VTGKVIGFASVESLLHASSSGSPVKYCHVLGVVTFAKDVLATQTSAGPRFERFVVP